VQAFAGAYGFSDEDYAALLWDEASFRIERREAENKIAQQQIAANIAYQQFKGASMFAKNILVANVIATSFVLPLVDISRLSELIIVLGVGSAVGYAASSVAARAEEWKIERLAAERDRWTATYRSVAR
jgi:hypothetical protein